MNAESYARAKRAFQRALELDPSERAAFVRSECGDDAEALREVEELLAHHREDSVIAPATLRKSLTKTSDARSPGWKRRRTITLATGALTLLVLTLGSWLYRRVEERLMFAAGAGLEAAVSRSAQLVEEWDWASGLGQLWARDPRVRHAAADLLRAEESGTLSAELPAALTLREGLAPHVAQLSTRGARLRREVDYLLFDFASNRLLAASPRLSSLVGSAASLAGVSALQRCRLQGPSFLLPHRISGLLQEQQLEGDEAVVSYATPVYFGEIEEVQRKEVERPAPEAVLMLVLTPELKLGVRTASDGTELPLGSGDTFLFDREGRLLSNLRSDSELRAVGLLGAGDTRSALDLVLRDPGRRLTADSAGLDPARPFTRLVALALGQRDSRGGEPEVLLEPYHDVLGREVIGAWTWLDAMDVGLATEVEAELVFASLNQIERAEQLLLGLVALLSLLAFYSSRSAESLTVKAEQGERLGQYELLELIGEGGSGRIYKARHALLQRVTAVKLIRPEVMSDTARERFAREARLASQLTHPNTIVIYDYGCSDQGTYYYAMEYLEGQTLADLLTHEEHLPVDRTLRILRQLLGSLAEAHSAGLVHRDIKPQNIMLVDRGGESDVVKVLDFGLVKAFEGEQAEDLELTAKGLVGGTPLYIAPDRYAGASEVDGRTDLYAVGTLAYRMLTGRSPFQAKTRVELSLAVLKDPVPHAREQAPQEIPLALDELIFSAMAKSPADRPASAEAMIAALDELERAHS